MKVIDFENFLLHPDLAVAEAAISGGPILVSGCRAGTAVILSLDAYNELKAAGFTAGKKGEGAPESSEDPNTQTP
ncbi:MAG: hypothetical protein KH696_07580 [Sutterella sp.]|uniref:hypothetical protein n=1 Tax=Dakarella massiliensis TaxID=1506471 RepID=UPI00033FF126|nr:hypothetical protein [Dakarella massiliensis]MBS6157037.1 hypothetical protein [Sutterella sp.]CDE51776.1 unknown [Sutterella sp. CAG:351]